MKKWAVMLFYTIGVAAVTYVSFRLALFGIFEATQFPNRLFLFGLTLLLFGTLAIGAGARKYIFSVSNNKNEAASKFSFMHRSGDLGDDLVFSLGSGGRSSPLHDSYRLLVCQKDPFFLCLC